MPRIILLSPDTQRISLWQGQLQPLGEIEVIDSETARHTLTDLQSCTLVYDLVQQLPPPSPQPGPDTHLIACGVPGSTPFRQMAEHHPFALLSHEDQPERLYDSVKHSQHILQLQSRNRFLEHKLKLLEYAAPTPQPLQTIPEDDRLLPDDLLEHITDPAALCRKVLKQLQLKLRVPRSGVFLIQDEHYQLIAGNNLSFSDKHLQFEPSHPFIQWLRDHLITLSHSTLDQILHDPDQLFLHDQLKRLRAQVILPLCSDGELIGWLFTGPRNEGGAYTLATMQSLENLGQQLADLLSISHRINKEESLQQNLQSLLGALPATWLLADSAGSVTWSSRPVNTLPIHLREAIYLAAEQGQSFDETTRHGDKHYRIIAQALPDNPPESRIIASFEDVTQQTRKQAQQQEQQLDDILHTLGLILSHELRNPLVSLKTFTQLLGLEHTKSQQANGHAQVHNDFSETILHEVNRLEAVAEHLNSLNNMSLGDLHATDPQPLINRILKDLDPNRTALKVDSDIRPFLCDAQQLETSLRDMLLYMHGQLRDDGSLKVSLQSKASGGAQLCIQGRGLDTESPTPTADNPMRPDAISLGFFKACQVIRKHRGYVDIRKNDQGYDLNILIREPA